MSISWRKVWRDLVHNKTRTLLAVLSTTVGVLALGMIFGMSGVMRAIGAVSPAVAGIFVSEGVFLGVLSWLLAVPLSYPSARLFSDVVGDTVVELPLDFGYSMVGVVLWLVIVVVLSTLASLWPALRATKVSVREALAYE
jgi:putative ABC transport system permease protein